MILKEFDDLHAWFNLLMYSTDDDENFYMKFSTFKLQIVSFIGIFQQLKTIQHEFNLNNVYAAKYKLLNMFRHYISYWHLGFGILNPSETTSVSAKSFSGILVSSSFVVPFPSSCLVNKIQIL